VRSGHDLGATTARGGALPRPALPRDPKSNGWVPEEPADVRNDLCANGPQGITRGRGPRGGALPAGAGLERGQESAGTCCPWTDGLVRAANCGTLLFVTAWQLAEDTAQVRYAKADGYRVVVVPDDIARSLGSLTDLDGRPMVDLNRYRDQWNDSFSFTFVEPRTMTASEQAVFAWTGEITALAHVDLPWRSVAVLISETMRLNDAGSPVLGVWEPAERRIVIRRDQLNGIASGEAQPAAFGSVFC
jgi:hypothetical protein